MCEALLVVARSSLYFGTCICPGRLGPGLLGPGLLGPGLQRPT